MNWTYQGNELTDIPDGYVGFVYLITNLQDKKMYVGKKLFNFTSMKSVKGKTRRKKVVKESDWKDYYGSSDYLKEEIEKIGKENFSREILHLCRFKAECSYMETWEIFNRHALLSDDYYNSWVSCKIHKTHVKNKILL